MLPVSLCLDFGNTTYKAALFHGDRLTEKFTFTPDDALNTIHKLIILHNPGKSILSSVVDHPEGIEELLKEKTRFILLNNSVRLPFLNAYGTPETLGNDRLALVAGLSKQFPGENSLVISVGTCITYNFLARNNAFRGGAISPGLDIRLKGMHEHTDKLPVVKREGHNLLLGYDTESSMRSGAINGLAAEIDGMIDRFRDQYGEINSVLTGGDGAFFESRIKNKIFADPNFLFKGLYAISEHNF
ncbi:MAG: type III pantothenate kinase [Chitinophagaceae bacterium]|nr:type III pantothenate kinase [Chitinophagaceae bacterium]